MDQLPVLLPLIEKNPTLGVLILGALILLIPNGLLSERTIKSNFWGLARLARWWQERQRAGRASLEQLEREAKDELRLRRAWELYVLAELHDLAVQLTQAGVELADEDLPLSFQDWASR